MGVVVLIWVTLNRNLVFESKDEPEKISYRSVEGSLRMWHVLMTVSKYESII